MDETHTLTMLHALGQESRLRAFRLLVEAEPEGLSAGRIANALAVPQNTLSSHLSILANAGLVTSRRESRHIIYRADIAAMQRLVGYLLANCCGGAGCLPEIEALAEACQ